MYIYFFYFNIQPYLSQHLKHPFHFFLFTPLSCCAFWSLCQYTALLHFFLFRVYHHSPVLPWLLLLVLYSRHQIFLFSFSDIFSPTIMFFLLHFAYLTLLSASLFLHFYASKQLSYYTFFSLSLEMKPCSWFFSVLVPLQLYLPYSTNITIFYLVFQPFSSNAMPLGGMPCTLLYSCVFFHRGHTSFFFFYYVFFVTSPHTLLLPLVVFFPLLYQDIFIYYVLFLNI